MSIYTASQAAQLVLDQQTSAANTKEAGLRTTFQWIFDSIDYSAGQGATRANVQVVPTQWALISPLLLTYGYTLTPAGEGIYDISWAVTAQTSTQVVPVPVITALNLVNFQGQKSAPFEAIFEPIGGTAPYTFTVSGVIPAGLSWSSLVSVSTITLSGTPTEAGNKYNSLSILVTDVNSQTFTQSIDWAILPETSVTVSPPTVNVAAPTVNVAAPQVTVSPPQVTVNLNPNLFSAMIVGLG